MNIIQRLLEIERQIRINRIIPGKGISATPSMTGTVVDSEALQNPTPADGNIFKNIRFGVYIGEDEDGNPAWIVNAGSIRLGTYNPFNIVKTFFKLSTLSTASFTNLYLYLTYSNGSFTAGITTTSPTGGTTWSRQIAAISGDGVSILRYYLGGDIEITDRWCD